MFEFALCLYEYVFKLNLFVLVCCVFILSREFSVHKSCSCQRVYIQYILSTNL